MTFFEWTCFKSDFLKWSISKWTISKRSIFEVTHFQNDRFRSHQLSDVTFRNATLCEIIVYLFHQKSISLNQKFLITCFQNLALRKQTSLGSNNASESSHLYIWNSKLLLFIFIFQFFSNRRSEDQIIVDFMGNSIWYGIQIIRCICYT